MTEKGPGWIYALRSWHWYGALTLAAGLFLLWATPWGVRIQHDSYYYITAAASFREGHGFSWLGGEGVLKPLTHFPPLYSLLLALVSLPKASIPNRASALAAILFGLSVSLVFWFIYHHSRNRWVSVLGTVMWMISPVVLPISFAAMTEILFMLLVYGCMSALAAYFVSEERSHLLLAGILFSLACLARYAGLALLPALVIPILLLKTEPLRSRIRDILILAGCGLFPVGVWFLRNFLVSGTLTNRTFAYHPVSLDDLRLLLKQISGWFTQVTMSNYVRLGILLLIAILYMLLVAELRRIGGIPSVGTVPLLVMIGLFVVFSVMLLVVSRSFFDASIRIDNRILFPIFVSGYLAFYLLIGLLCKTRWKYAAWVLLTATVTAHSLTYLPATVGYVQAVRMEGEGFFSRSMRSSSVMDFVRARGCVGKIVTNNPELIFLHTGCQAARIPETHDPLTLIDTLPGESTIRRLQERLEEDDSYLILFGSDPVPSYFEDMVPVLDDLEGRVYSQRP